MAESRHYPYGGERWTWPEDEGGTFPTDYRFTGQRLDGYSNLYIMGARWYDSYLNRFLSPDTIIPQPGNPQSLNRYSYTLGNPLKYRDPSGHWVETAWDVANIGWDIYEVSQDPSLLNIACLVVDVGAAALPFVPGGAGLLARGGKAAVKVATHSDEMVTTAKLVSKADVLGTATKILSRADEAVQWGKNYLQNYDTFYKIARDPDFYQVHHILPQQFADILGRAGINVHDPRLLREIPIRDTVTGGLIHQRLYTDVWTTCEVPPRKWIGR